MSGDDSSDLYGLREDKSPRQEKITCPGCGKRLPQGSVLCVDCGYNFRTGKRLQPKSLETPGEDDEDPDEERPTEDERYVRLRTEWSRGDYVRYWLGVTARWAAVLAVVVLLGMVIVPMFLGPRVADSDLAEITPGMPLEEVIDDLRLGITKPPMLQPDGLDLYGWVIDKGQPGMLPGDLVSRRELRLFVRDGKVMAPPQIYSTDDQGRPQERWIYTPAWKSYIENLSDAERRQHGRFATHLHESVPVTDAAGAVAE